MGFHIRIHLREQNSGLDNKSKGRKHPDAAWTKNQIRCPWSFFILIFLSYKQQTVTNVYEWQRMRNEMKAFRKWQLNYVFLSIWKSDREIGYKCIVYLSNDENNISWPLSFVKITSWDFHSSIYSALMQLTCNKLLQTPSTPLEREFWKREDIELMMMSEIYKRKLCTWLRFFLVFLILL